MIIESLDYLIETGINTQWLSEAHQITLEVYRNSMDKCEGLDSRLETPAFFNRSWSCIAKDSVTGEVLLNLTIFVIDSNNNMLLNFWENMEDGYLLRKTAREVFPYTEECIYFGYMQSYGKKARYVFIEFVKSLKYVSEQLNVPMMFETQGMTMLGDNELSNEKLNLNPNLKAILGECAKESKTTAVMAQFLCFKKQPYYNHSTLGPLFTVNI